MRSCEYMYGMFGLYCVSLLHVKYVCAVADWCSSIVFCFYIYSLHQRYSQRTLWKTWKELVIYQLLVSMNTMFRDGSWCRIVEEMQYMPEPSDLSATDTAAEQLKRYS